MTSLTKVLIGTAVVAVGATVAVVVASKDETVAVVKADEKQGIKVDVEDKSILTRIKKYVKKKVVKLLSWVTIHMEQIEAAGAIIGLGSTVIGIASAVRDFAKGNDMQRQLDDMQAELESLHKDQKLYSNAIGQYVEHCTTVTNNNLKLLDKAHGYTLDAIAEKVGLNVDELDQGRNEAISA